MNRLGLAMEALGAGDRPEALKHLLARWRSVPDPDLAVLIERVAPEADAWGEASAARCLQALARPMDGVLGRILATVPRLPAQEAGRVLEGLRAWPLDPRLSGALLGWLEHPPWTGSHGQKAWRRVFRLLEHRQDDRIASLEDYDAKKFFGEAMGPWVAGRIDRLLVASRPPPPQLPPEESSLLESFHALLDAGSDPMDALWRAAFETPMSDSPRLVLADALTERDDPRGEFIALQIHGGAQTRSRVRSLLRTHGADWCGALDGVLLTRGRRFVRGFLDAGVIRPRTLAAAEAAMGDPHWATLTELEMRSSLTRPRVFELATQAATRSLRVLRGLLDAEQLVEVLRNPHRKPLRHLGLATDPWVQTWSVPSGRPSVRVDLQTLEISTSALALRRWIRRTLGQVPALVLTTADVPVSGLLHLHARDALGVLDGLRPLARDRVALVVGPTRPVLRASISRDEDWRLRLTILRTPARPTGADALNAALDSLDPGAVIEVRVPEAVAAQLEGLERFDVALI